MQDPIFIRGVDGALKRVEQTPYGKEYELQNLISAIPELIPGSSLDGSSQRRWLLVRNEAGIPNYEGGGNWWAVDHLLVDQAGIPTFVEVKRSKDSRARREVVAQMLDYVANATAYWQTRTLQARFNEVATSPKSNPDQVLSEFLVDSDLDVDSVWARVEENIRSAHVRRIFVSDSVPPSLIRLVEFINEHLATEFRSSLFMSHISRPTRPHFRPHFRPHISATPRDENNTRQHVF